MVRTRIKKIQDFIKAGRSRGRRLRGAITGIDEEKLAKDIETSPVKFAAAKEQPIQTRQVPLPELRPEEEVQKDIQRTRKDIIKNEDGTFTVIDRATGQKDELSDREFRIFNAILSGSAPAGFSAEEIQAFGQIGRGAGGELGEALTKRSIALSDRRRLISELRALAMAEGNEAQYADSIKLLTEIPTDLTVEQAAKVFEQLGESLPDAALGQDIVSRTLDALREQDPEATRLLERGYLFATNIPFVGELFSQGLRNREIGVAQADRVRTTSKEILTDAITAADEGATSYEDAALVWYEQYLLNQAADASLKKQTDDFIGAQETTAKDKRIEVRNQHSWLMTQRAKIIKGMRFGAPKAQPPETTVEPGVLGG